MTISHQERGTKAEGFPFRSEPLFLSISMCSASPGHFDRSLAKGFQNHTWVWNLPRPTLTAFRQPTSDLEEVSRQRSSSASTSALGRHFHFLAQRRPSITVPASPRTPVGWPIPCTVPSQVRSGLGRSLAKRFSTHDVGAGIPRHQITSGLFHVWRAWGFTNEFQLLCHGNRRLGEAGSCSMPVVFHYHQGSSQKLDWFPETLVVLNTIWAGLLGLGSFLDGHLLHVSLPTTS